LARSCPVSPPSATVASALVGLSLGGQTNKRAVATGIVTTTRRTTARSVNNPLRRNEDFRGRTWGGYRPLVAR